VARPELGIKRQCQSCGAKFYDLNRDPIACPKCGTIFQVTALPAVAAAATAAARVRPEPAAPRPVAEREDAGEEALEEEAADVELVSLEDAEEGTPGSKSTPADEDLEIEEEGDSHSGDDDSFLEEDMDADDDVSDLIDGDIEDDEEA